MTIVEGQIETLKKLKESLTRSGITSFSSIGEIRRFLRGFDAEKKQLPHRIEKEFEAEIQYMRSALVSNKNDRDELRTKTRNEIEQQINELEAEIDRVNERSSRNGFNKFLYYFKLSSLSRKARRLNRSRESAIKKKTKSAEKAVAKLEEQIENLLKNNDKLVSERCEESLKDLTYTKEVVDSLYTLVAGAIGETSVVNILSQLSDDYYLINDFSLEFNPPIYNRKENDRIFSIQIDHLLVCRSGIFLLETKNWSRASVESLDLRSPVKQILRTSFALFVLLNSESRHSRIRLEKHHWGDGRISIRNIIVMINEKPKEEFKHVKVVSLNELIGYIQYFEPVFDDGEVREIVKYLTSRM